MITNGKIQLFPFLRVAVCLILGIVAGDKLIHFINIPAVFVIALTLLLLQYTLRNKPIIASCMLMLTTTLIGVLTIVLAEKQFSVPLPDKPILYEAVITSKPMDKGKTVKCDLLITRVNENKCEKPFKIKATILKDKYEKHYTQLKTGYGIKVFSLLSPNVNYYPNSNFDYAGWLKVHGFIAQTFIYYDQWQQAEIDISGLSNFNRARIKAIMLREKLISYYRQHGINAQRQAIVAAMTLGDKSNISHKISEAYSVSGTSHILALSGSNLSMIYMLLLFLFPGNNFRLLSRCVILIAIWLYVVLVGMEASVVRAGVMISVYSFATLLNRNNTSFNALFLTVAVMLLLDPLNLWDVGFQLSFAAVLSILVFFAPIYRVLHIKTTPLTRVVRWIWAIVAMSVSAQIGTAPLVLFYFGRLSCYFLISNLIVIPMSTLILYCAFGMLVLAPFIVIQRLISHFLGTIVGWLNDYVVWIASLPGASIDDIHINSIQVLLLYALMAAIFFFVARLKRAYKLAPV